MGVYFESASELYGTTSVENLFITAFMPKADGDFVKVYLYGLKNVQNPQKIPLSNEQLAKELNITEKTIDDAYLYWQEKGLVDIRYIGEDYTVVFYNITEIINQNTGPKTDINTIPSDLKDVKEFKFLINAIENYLNGQIITIDMMNTVKTWVKDYEMEYPCLYYLFDYCDECIGKNNFNPLGKFKYACAVADSWYHKEIRTLNEAQAQTEDYQKHNKLVYHVLRELGLQRKPLRKERNYVNKWMDTYNFTEEMIQEGINRTGKQSFEYLDSILTDWYQKGYKNPDEIIDFKRSRPRNKANTMNKVSEDRIEAVQRYENSIFENFKKNLEALD